MRSLSSLALALLASTAVAAPPAGLQGERARMVSDLAALRFDQLGNPVLRWDAIPPVYAPAGRPHRLLVVLAEFADRKFVRFQGDATQGARLAAWYQDQLFDPKYEKRDTLSHFYAVQSLDTYHLQGQVLAPVTLSKPRAAYGAPYRPEGGDWRNDADTEGMAEEVLVLAAKAHPELDWASFDRWDPLDHDGDGVLDEADGYLDHLVIVFAGGGQSSCQGLYKLDEALNPNVGPEAVAKLSADERECADRIWPHRFMIQKREGQGPVVEGRVHGRGGAPLRPGLWALDYNMQSEYTEASTFIHEFGHSIGLPDVYARETSNSTGCWELMSSTAAPSPQNLSAWSRLMLGWLRPRVVLPPEFGGKAVQSGYLRTLDAPLDPPAVAREAQRQGMYRAAMVVLPPKTIDVQLTALPKGGQALYSGQGNALNRSAELRLDLAGKAGPVELSFEAWWEIEAGWDFAYVEASVDEGASWTRLLPADRQHMPAKHGHDGKQTLPGFTGLSGDLDGDGKNESAPGCDPKKQTAHGDEVDAAQKDPCQVPTWVRPAFDLSAYAGKAVRVRLRYFTDMAAVMRGLLVDDVRVTAAGAPVLTEDFEGKPGRAWRLDGFTPSPGQHTLLVPHYYLLEYRDPDLAGSYDGGIVQDTAFRFFYDPEKKAVRALRARARPGVVAWYYDGAYAWSENDPATNGPGKGFLLALDALPDEIALPGYPLAGTPGAFDTRYALDGTQAWLEAGYYAMMCFVRDAGWRPKDLDAARCPTADAPANAVQAFGKPLLYSYKIINDFLPGPDRARYAAAGELLDYRMKDKAPSWRMRDRSLRYLHTLDAPFALAPYPDAIEIFDVVGGKLVRAETRAYPAVAAFTDATPARWLNPGLRFGGVAVPDAGFSFRLTPPGPEAPAGARVKVWFDWN
ncbi:MAG: immune inhibitor A [bacterium]